MASKYSQCKCDVSSAWAALVRGRDNYYMYNDEAFIGRSEGALVIITDNAVSRKHCVIKRDKNNKFTICDLSNCGTYVNNKRLEKNVPVNLRSSDTISILNIYSYTFRINKKRVDHDQTTTMTNTMEEELCTLDINHIEMMGKINDEIDKMGREMTGLEQKMGNMSNDKVKTNSNKKSLDTLKSKINELNKREKELRKAKDEMETQHKKERAELEARWKNDIKELQRKLKNSEEEKIRLEGKTNEIKKMLTETKETLKESELEQKRLFEEKEEVKNKLESTTKHVINLTENKKTYEKEIEERTNRVEEQEIELKQMEENTKKIKSSLEQVEESLVCSICTEVFIDPYALDCHHSFCKVCIEQWKQKRKTCPVCRLKFTTCQRAFFYDGIIDTVLKVWTADERKRRNEIIQQRNQGPVVRAKKRKHSNQPPVPAVVIQDLSLPEEQPVPRPEVSSPIVVPDEMNIPEFLNDPFEWNNRPMARRSSGRTRRQGRPPQEPNDPQVLVAAIDLTNLSPAQPIRPVTGSIDLTSL